MVDAWLASADLRPVSRVERDGTTAWDLLLDGRRRIGLRVTVIHHPGLGLIVWLPWAPPLQDNQRRAYQQLLQWNDELPFVKFGLDAALRPVLSVEIAPEAAGPRSLGLGIARVLAVCDHLVEVAPSWLRLPPAPAPASARPSPSPAGPATASGGVALLERYAADLAELTDAPATLADDDRAAGSGASGIEGAGGP
jgi:Putative bacterial sensory transduction regulator